MHRDYLRMCPASRTAFFSGSFGSIVERFSKITSGSRGSSWQTRQHAANAASDSQHRDLPSNEHSDLKE